GLLAGSYPAFYLSSFQSAHILKSGSGGKNRKSRIRSLLVIFQFAISVSLIIGTIVIRNQLYFILNKDLGFNKESVLSIINGSSLGNNLKIFLQEISDIPGVECSTASSLMFAPGVPGNGYIYEGMTGDQVIPAQMLDIDHDFARTYSIKMKSGRFFDRAFRTDSSAVVINATMAGKYINGNPLGKTLYAMNNETKELVRYSIIGIIKDFNYESLHKTVRPLVLHLSPVRQAATVIAVRLRPKDGINTISRIEQVWSKYSDSEKMYTRFLDENIERMYNSEKKIALITTIFAALAIIIACLGLFGLVSFITEQRTKEIGIRKVLGASVFEIIVLITKDFVKWVLLANLISWPVAYYFLNDWLSGFAYRTEISWIVFINAGLITLIIAVSTICVQVIKVAARNPVTSLRYE
ncbi:MAG: ABC transporter permease, partial [Syntrophothermus sp.]